MTTEKNLFHLSRTRFSNGVTLLHLFTPNDPISACHLLIPGGVNPEPPSKAGLTTLQWSLLLKGTKSKSSKQLAEMIEGIGAFLGGGATHDFSEISCHAVAEYFPEALRLMAETILEPAFRAEEVEKEKVALLAAIRSKKENIFTIAHEEMNNRLFGRHPYARPSAGSEESVRSITRNDLVRWHARSVVPNKAILAVASHIPWKRTIGLMEGLFGEKAWRKARSMPSSASSMPAMPTKPVEVTRREVFEQAYLMIGFRAPEVTSPDYVPLKVVNGLLGGGMSTRLFQNLREKEGLAYDVGSFFPTRVDGSSFVFYLGLQAARIEEAKRRIAIELRDIIEKPVPAQELRQIKNYLKGTFILDHQTNSQRAHYFGWWSAIGLKASFDNHYIERINTVSAADVRAVAKKYFSRPPVTVEVRPKPAVHGR